MKFSELRDGMTVLAVDDYADCIHKGTEYRVTIDTRGAYIECDHGSHYLDGNMMDDGSIPEFEPTP